jgi:general stress protein 26
MTFKLQNLHRLLFTFLVIAGTATYCSSQEKHAPPKERDSMIAAAREIMGLQKYCALITVDSTGQPHARTMNPFPPDSNMVVWIATNSRTRKAAEMMKSPRVCVYYADHGHASGYVALYGRAVLVNDDQEKLKRKREYWNQAFPDWKYLLLIKVVPERLEVINYRRGMLNDPTTWSPPSIEFDTH